MGRTTIRTAARLLPAGFTLLALAACGSSVPPPVAKSASPAARYVVGADPGDDPCARIVSAIGFADALLRPPGEEDRQEFDEGVRGRIAYVEGVVLEYGPRLPGQLLEYEARLRETTHGLVPAATRPEDQVRLLKEYRAAADSVKKGCAKA
ncbi:hypothetical protein [Planotetraspora sp. GP83]|uniref:hypothetical protein n=1 Tax=Planotetraspora sp. GP83 TaxID=3156264 RepID=UPI0035190FF6